VGLSRSRTLQSPMTAEIVIDGERYVSFAGSSYLGLAGRTEILEAGASALGAAGSGYQLARHYRIATQQHYEAEAQAARFFASEAALFMPGGYAFGLIALAVLRQRFNRIFYDELAHFCLREAIAASGLPAHPFHHLDADDLHRQLATGMRNADRPLIVTDGLYSTFGEIAPLDQLLHVAAPYEGYLLIDESHSFGVLGETGRGAREHHGVPASAALSGGSTGKAFGVLGGIIPGSEAQIEACRAAPACRGATAGLPAAAAMCARSFDVVRRHPQLLRVLRTNVAYLKHGLRALGLNIADNVAPVATFVSGTDNSMRALQERLMSEGIYVLYSTYVGAGPAGAIRCGIFADHTVEHMDRLIDALRRLL
jgi:8-amino-7-oxononanoate synthase